MYCRSCGTKINDDAQFCYACGLKTDVQETPKSEPEVADVNIQYEAEPIPDEPVCIAPEVVELQNKVFRFGIASVVISYLSVLNILAIIFGAIARKKAGLLKEMGCLKGKAKVGNILGLIGLILGIFNIVILICLVAFIIFVTYISTTF